MLRTRRCLFSRPFGLQLWSVLFWAALSPCSGAEPRTFSVGVEDYPNFLPYSSCVKGQYSGLGRDILDAFAHERGYVFRYEVYPLKRRDRLFVEGRLDFSFPDNPNWVADLKKKVSIAYAPMLEFTDGVLLNASDRGKGVAHLKVLGIPLGFTPYPYQQLMMAGALRVEESQQYDALYEQLIMRRVDGAYMNTRIARHYWSRLHPDRKTALVYDANLPHASGYWYLSSIKYSSIIDEFKRYLAAHRQDVDELKKRYGFDAAEDE
ncbi:MAG: hypothetical protein JO006_12050 [Paucibacter sp.]|nr:hypothetical protein [Roseateles sp.]